MVTTIKIHHSTKSQLDTIKEHNMSYDDAIQKLLASQKQEHITQQLIQGYQALNAHAEELSEWDAI